MKRISVKNIILIAITVLVVAGSIWLPGFLMEKENSSYYGKTNSVPSDYYSGPSESIIKNASKQLNSEQCIQLVTGVWDSTITPADPEDCTFTDFGMKTLMISHVQNLYTKGLYPCSLSSNNDNWYSWEAKPYRALDSTFRTYAAYFWDISFTKYDGTETHRFIVTEFGDIVYAEAETKENFGGFSPKLTNSSYLLNYYSPSISYTTYSVDDESGKIVTSVTLEEESRAYKTNSLSPTSDKAKNIMKQIETSSSFIKDFEAFEPDNLVTLTETGGVTGIMKYSVCSKATYNSFKLIVLPEKSE